MTTKLDSGKAQTLQKLLNEARAEADSLRPLLKRYEQIILSTRLIMGHELKKPTTAIAGYLDLALDDADGGRYADSLESIEKARGECELLNELNLFFLELLKVESNPETLCGKRSTIDSFITEIFEHFPDDLDAKSRVQMRISPDAQHFRANANAFKMILSNIIENALNYSPKDTPVTVDIDKVHDKRGLGDRDLLRIKVTDKGPGIPKVYVQKIFSPFVRLHGDEVNGSGLGLTLVRSLVDLCDGDVYINSDGDSGTTVHVTIPEMDEEALSGQP